MCFMKEGSAMSNGFASSLMLAGPLLNRPRTARRVGSANAWKMPFNRSGYCSIRLSITEKYLVQRLSKTVGDWGRSPSDTATLEHGDWLREEYGARDVEESVAMATDCASRFLRRSACNLSAVDDDRLSAGRIGLHDTMGFMDLVEAEDPDRLDVEPAGGGIGRDLLQRHIRE